MSLTQVPDIEFLNSLKFPDDRRGFWSNRVALGGLLDGSWVELIISRTKL